MSEPSFKVEEENKFKKIVKIILLPNLMFNFENEKSESFLDDYIKKVNPEPKSLNIADNEEAKKFFYKKQYIKEFERIEKDSERIIGQGSISREKIFNDILEEISSDESGDDIEDISSDESDF